MSRMADLWFMKGTLYQLSRHQGNYPNFLKCHQLISYKGFTEPTPIVLWLRFLLYGLYCCPKQPTLGKRLYWLVNINQQHTPNFSNWEPIVVFQYSLMRVSFCSAQRTRLKMPVPPAATWPQSSSSWWTCTRMFRSFVELTIHGEYRVDSQKQFDELVAL